MRKAVPLWLILVASCTLDPGSPELSEADSALVASNKVTSNKITSNQLLASTLGLAALSESDLSSHAMLETADTREVLSFIVSCALPAGAQITASYAGQVYTFPGQLGLAPGWAIGAPTAADRRWVTACLLARANLHGEEVSISIRHRTNPALSALAAEKAEYYRVEGAFYGDLFQRTPALYACGSRQWTAPTPGAPRSCALSPDGITTDCGFVYTGLCTAGGSAPCQERAAPYGGCTGGGTVHEEVITVYLHP